MREATGRTTRTTLGSGLARHATSRRHDLATRARTAAIGLLVLACSACAPSEPVEVAPPDQAGDPPPDGPWEVRADLTASSVIRSLEDSGGHQVDHYQVPLDATWDQITAHYTEELGDGWKEDEIVTREGAEYTAATWVNDGLFGEATVAVALIPEPAPESDVDYQILTVIASE